MDEIDAIDAFAALAQGTRLQAFRLIVSHMPNGLQAGEVARQLGVPHNTMSTHLALLSRANLIKSERQSRSIVYRADLEGLRRTVAYLLKECCGGRPDLCSGVIADLEACCVKPEPEDV